ncbi:hypothetical protein ABB37_09983 [Leptomonas pyrrhocoris]|uniref:KY-like immunoglobulin-like domain-containing protein n=1 Tax=Leptomonas pyrrhocoris TaxID=157538 RepID=A0A0N0VCM0_LEPPY|nr:hypothetical protein ABB37_09983 [Leptomonas pyrrhocoris]KPA73271.1 hypothetical protein ABB37_09983 [Leptomonas pyrrhocoris]|eukprot:XP_015651710.1 hypothetical protein ABB37_09983 [Leptomonas pyrrhocoris]
MQFGDSLYKCFARQHEDAEAKMPLTRYADYLHHFGFSVERESCTRGAADVSSGGGSKTSFPNTTPLQPSLASGHLINYGSEDSSALSDTADWGISEETKKEADQRCEDVGAISGVSDWEAVAKELTAPYNSVTWRQTTTQCIIKKARCVYAWLCAHVALQLRLFEETAGEADGAPAATATKPQRSVSAGKKGNRLSKKEKEAAAAVAAAAALEPPKPVDPLVQAMAARRATPLLLAQLYASMLGAVGVKCEVVVGRLKGVAPGEAVEWAWNVLRIDGRAYLVDAAAALSDGVLRSSPAPSPVPAADTAVLATPSHTAAGGGAAPATAAPGAPPKDTSGGDDGGGDATAGWGVPRLLSTTPAELRRDFFFFTHPCLFLSSHLPNDAAKSLVATPTRAVHWVIQPCVTPAFYHYGLQLLSHPSHAAISVGSTPTYISLTNKAPGKTELCCVLFSGTLQALSEDVSSNTPLAPGWVWHQRVDTTNTETFTLTVPQAGYYVVVIGARSIRADPYSAAIVSPAASTFTAVVSYEVRVGFTSSNVPVLPRQYLSPGICRLMKPLCAQVTPGPQRFSVMPSCSNVLAVAVVRRVALQGTATASVSTSTDPSSNPAHHGHTRSLVSFLTFQMKMAAFEGVAEVKAGDIIELWVLYGAPDRNGQQLTQRVGALQTNAARAPAAVEVKTADRRKKKAAATEQQQVDMAQVARLEHALRRGELFQLLVGGIEVKHFISPDVVAVIQPQPTVEQEQAATLRRLAGVTEALLSEAGSTAQYQANPVGSYFEGVATAAATR